MVWILVPNHPSLGASKYYLTAKGTYKIGRKDCAIVIQTDKTVSRLHAEIIISSGKDGSDTSDSGNACRPKIVLRDLSKFGSFVNRSPGSRPIFSLSNKEKELNEGDIVTFGTDNSSFKLEYFAFHPHIAALADDSRRHSMVRLAASAGGCITDLWCSECSHLIVEDGSDVTSTVIQAVADKKPVVGLAWIEALSARSSLTSEFASCSRFTPNLQWIIDNNAKFLKIIDPAARSLAFNGLVFYIGSTYLYGYRDLLQCLVGASGGSVRSVTEVARSRSRVPRDPQQKSNDIIILPDLEPKIERWLSPEEVRSISHMRRTTEVKFVAAVLTGEFPDEYYEDPASPAASVSSDETVEASNSASHEDEISSANQGGKQPFSVGKAGRSTMKSNTPITNEKTSHIRATCSQRQDEVGASLLQSSTKTGRGPYLVSEQTPVLMENFKDVQKLSRSVSHSHPISQGVNGAGSGGASRMVIEESGEGTAAIEFRSDLIVYKDLQPLQNNFTSDSSVKNYKCFKKKDNSSGNSFAALVPFAKEPYREADFNKEVQEYLQQEKKRKQAEAMAEELFNAEQLKRKKGVGTSLVTALREGRIKMN